VNAVSCREKGEGWGGTTSSREKKNEGKDENKISSCRAADGTSRQTTGKSVLDIAGPLVQSKREERERSGGKGPRGKISLTLAGAWREPARGREPLKKEKTGGLITVPEGEVEKEEEKTIGGQLSGLETAGFHRREKRSLSSKEEL